MLLESFPVDIVSGFQQIFQQPKNPKNPGFLCHSYLSFPDSWISSLARGLPLGPHAAIDVEASADSSGQRARSSENESNKLQSLQSLQLKCSVMFRVFKQLFKAIHVSCHHYGGHTICICYTILHMSHPLTHHILSTWSERRVLMRCRGL